MAKDEHQPTATLLVACGCYLGLRVEEIIMLRCRHTACTRLIYLAKGDLSLVQSITGHRTLSELQRYLHATGDRRHTIAEAYETMVDDLQIGPSYLRVGQ